MSDVPWSWQKLIYPTTLIKIILSEETERGSGLNLNADE